MNRFAAGILALSGLAATACTPVTSGGGGATTDLLSDYKTLKTTDITDLTPVSAIGSTGSASFSGVAQVARGTFSDGVYIGALDVDVAFSNGTLSGSLNSFQELETSGSTSTLGPEVNGTVDISGAIDSNNSIPRGGISGTATGDLDGKTIDSDFDGNFIGSTGSTLLFYFSGGLAGSGYAVED